MSAKQAINDKLQGSIATNLRCGGAVRNQIKESLLPSVRVKKNKNRWVFGKVASKSVVEISQNYGDEYVAPRFGPPCILAASGGPRLYARDVRFVSTQDTVRNVPLPLTRPRERLTVRCKSTTRHYFCPSSQSRLATVSIVCVLVTPTRDLALAFTPTKLAAINCNSHAEIQ